MTSAERTIKILYLTDIHARIEPQARDIPPTLRALMPLGGHELTLGLAAIEQVVVREKKLAGSAPVLFINCGDIIGIEMVHDWTGRGIVTLEALEAITERAGIEHCFSVVGNHEMDFGIDGFRGLSAAARRFRFLAGNLTIDGAPQSAPFEVVEIAGLRIALLSLTVELTRIDAPAPDRGRLDVALPRPAAVAALAEIRARKARGEIDLAIGAVHLWDHEDELVAGLDGLDLLLGGHSHVFHNKTLGAGAVRYGKAGCHAQVLGTVTLTLSKGGVAASRSWLIPGAVDPAFDSKALEVLTAAVARIKLTHPERFREIARLPAPIEGCGRVRVDEVPIGRAVAEMILATARRASDAWVHFAFINGGNIRQDLHGSGGAVRATDLHAVVPYGNEILLVDASPDVVMRVLYNFVACAKVEPSGFLQVAGIRLRVDADGVIHDVEVQVEAPGSGSLWRSLTGVGTVRLATIDFLVREEGGHHYRFLGDGPVVATGRRLADAWAEALSQAASPGTPLPDLLAPAERCLTLDEDLLLTADRRKVLANVNARTQGRLAWIAPHL